jgi:hypothetical protein
MLPDIESHMTAAGPNTADLDMAIMDKSEPNHDPLAEHPLGIHETTVKKRSINVQSCMNNHMVRGKVCRVLAAVYSASDQAKTTHFYSAG